MKIAHQSDYAVRRAAEYPPIADQLDALWKIIQASNILIPAEPKSMADAIRSIKSKYPKS